MNNSEYIVTLFRLKNLVDRARNNHTYFGMISQNGELTGSIHDAWAIQMEITTAVSYLTTLVNDLMKTRSTLVGIISNRHSRSLHYYPLFVEDPTDQPQMFKRLLMNTFWKLLAEMHYLIQNKVLPKSQSINNQALTSHHRMIWDFFTLNILSKILDELKQAHEDFQRITLFARIKKYVWIREAGYRAHLTAGFHLPMPRHDPSAVVPIAITLSSNVMRRAMEFII
jgi:hypothetical protein